MIYAVVGGGAAGLMAACTLARTGAGVYVLEKQNRVGKKLLATGNGRCNFTNLDASPAHYRGSRAHVEAVLSRFPAPRILEEFDRMGIPAFADEQGRVYPASNAASSVLDALRLTLRENGGEERTDFDVTALKKTPNGFLLRAADGKTLECDQVLIACGGAAAPKQGGGTGGYELLRRAGHRVTPLMPAIASVNTDLEPIRGLKGLRVRCSAALLDGEEELRRESGEVLFAEYGLSGICVMQLSGHIHGLKNPVLSLDLAPDYPEKALFERVRQLEKRPLEDLLNGLLPRRVGWNVLRMAGVVDLTRLSGSLSRKETAALWRTIRDFRVPVTGVRGFDSAQVTMGGADMTEFDAQTLESRLVPGLFVAGEVCDVDGDCGGFNLHWAWASALTAAESMLQI